MQFIFLDMNSDTKHRIMIIILPVLILTIILILPFQSQQNKYVGAIVLGGEWFLNNQDESFLYYEYDYVKKIHSDESHPLREMASLWSITKLSKFLDDERYDKLAKRGFNHFEFYFERDSKDDFYFVNIPDKGAKLGHSAFIILALIEINHAKKDDYLKKFADGIILMQNGDGSLNTFFYLDTDNGKDYYPGEALLALMSLYEYTNDERYLDTIERAFPYYAEYFRKNPNTAFVPWQTRAYYKFYKVKEDRAVADFIFEMNDFMLEENQPRDKCSNFTFPGGIRVAVYMEGVNKAYSLARELEDEKAECYLNFIEEGADYLLTLQITDAEKEAVGGFKGSEKSETMRVDRNQHAVLALMEAYELGVLGK